MRQGQLDLHGQPRHVTWTRLARTAEANTTSLTLQQEVDWRAGDRLVIAPTGKDGNETEVHTQLRLRLSHYYYISCIIYCRNVRSSVYHLITGQ